jgi:hypothetical protein
VHVNEDVSHVESDAAVAAEHGDKLDHDLTLVDSLAISRGKATEIDLRVSYTGTMTVAEQDAFRANTFAELRSRVGPLRLTMVFSDHPIHVQPTI